MKAFNRTAGALLIGVDVGTSAVKTVLLEADSGRLLRTATREHRQWHPRAGWSEHDPDDWYAGVVATVREVMDSVGADRASVQGLAIAGQRDPFILLDREGTVLRHSISWTDHRSAYLLPRVLSDIGRERLIDITGVTPIPGLGLFNLLWHQENEPRLWEQVAHLLSPKDYIMYRLTGEMITDHTTPTRSAMNDVRRNDWSEELLSYVRVPRSFLPEFGYKPWEASGRLTRQGATDLGLLPGLTLGGGGGDDACATFGGGVIRSGGLCAGTGTASDWRMVTDRYTPDLAGRCEVSPHVVPDKYFFEVTMDSTGAALRWFRDTHYAGTGASYDDIVLEALRAPAGCDGLMFFPYVDGALRAPRGSAEASGAFIGIKSGHGREHMARAVIEGIAMHYPLTLAQMSEFGTFEPPITLVDGEAVNGLWNQLKCDITGVSIRVPEIVETAAVGAAMLAGIACREYSGAAEAVNRVVRWASRYDPDPEAMHAYAPIRERYELVYDGLLAAFRAQCQQAPALEVAR